MALKTEKEKVRGPMSPIKPNLMLSGEYYNALDPELVRMHSNAVRLLNLFNSSQPNLESRENKERTGLLKELLGTMGEGCYIEPPFRCDYGTNIHLGKNVYMNFNCCILDCNTVTIGDNTLMAPNIGIYPATHPTDPTLRLKGLEMALPVTIGKNVWIGGGVTICPGVTIGDNSVIGAGSVVVKDIPANVVAVGNPARVVKQLTPPQ